MSKVAIDVAEMEFQRFADAMDLDVSTGGMSAEDLEGFTQQRGRVLRAIQRGTLVINDKGEPEFSPARSDGAAVIVFHEPTGATLMAMDAKKKGQDIGKTYASMADMTRTHASTFAKMPMADLKVCMAIFTLFMG